MGLFDTVYASGDVAAVWDLGCKTCGAAPAVDAAWQTKSLDACMHSYFLRHDPAGEVRLYLLHRPSDDRFWRQWTAEEVEESERQASGGDALRAMLLKRRGEGRYLPEAYLPQNRRQRFMGELPHQWVEIYRGCACGAFVSRWIKFIDGVAREVRHEAPAHPPGFFDGAGGW